MRKPGHPRIYRYPSERNLASPTNSISSSRYRRNSVSPALLLKLKNLRRKSGQKASPASPSQNQHFYTQDQTPQYYQSHLPFPQRKPVNNSSAPQYQWNRKKQGLRLFRRNSSLVRTSSVSPRPGSLRGLPYKRSSRVPEDGQSPVMLVRKRSTSRSIRGSPISRFFRKLFRQRHKAKYFFNKSDLKRQLSFEIRESPEKSVKYEVKSMQMMSMKPTVRRQQKNATQEASTEPQLYSPKPTNATVKPSSLLGERATTTEQPPPLPPALGTNSGIATSAEFKEFDYDYRDRLKSHISQVNQDTTTNNFQRKRSMINRNKSYGRSPLIRRVDLYDNPNPALQLDEDNSALKRGMSTHNNDDTRVDEALAFVETWSSYLRRAVAVRVVLRQEIHSMEAEEEEEYQRQQARKSLSSSSSNSSLASSASTDTASTTASSISESSDFSETESSIAGGQQSWERSIAGEKGVRHTPYYENDSSRSTSRSDEYPRDQDQGEEQSSTSGYSFSSSSNIVTRPRVYSRNFQEQRERIDAIKKSLEQGRMHQKYSSLVQQPQKSPKDYPQPRARQISEYRLPTSPPDSLESYYKPDHESAWMSSSTHGKGQPLRVARPLPNVPPTSASMHQNKHQPTRTVSGPPEYLMSQPQHGAALAAAAAPSPPPVSKSPTPPPVPPKDVPPKRSPPRSPPQKRDERNVSDQILKDMYQELEELQNRSAQLSTMVNHQKRDSGIETHSRRSSIASKESTSSSESGAELSRGKGNRKRRPRSKVYLDKRASVLETPWTIQPQDLQEREGDWDARSEDSGITFDESSTQWKSSIGRNPLLIEVGDVSRPPSASESRFI